MIKNSIGTKLTLAAFVSVVLALGALAALLSWQIWADAHQAAQRHALLLVDQVHATLSAYNDSAKEQAQRDFRLFKSRVKGNFSVGGTASDPVLLLDDHPLNGVFDVVDSFTADTGGTVATLFVRKGDDYLRISTSLLNAKGERAMGTLLDRKSPAYALMEAGQTYTGRTNLFGKEYMALYEPIRNGSQTIGILFIGSDITSLLGRLNQNIRSLTFGTSGAVYAVTIKAGNNQGKFLGMREGVAAMNMDNQASKDWIKALTDAKDDSILGNGISPLQAEGSGTSADRLLGVRHFDPWGLAIVADAPKAELMDNASSITAELWWSVLIIALVMGVVLVWTSNVLVVKPIRALTGSLSGLAAGDLQSKIVVSSGDEIGELCIDMESFREQLAQSLRIVQDSAAAVSTVSSEIAEGNRELSARTENQAGALQQTSSSMDELNATVRQNAEHAQEANALATSASQVAEQGGVAVGQVVDTMQGISESAREISNIIKLINEIAFQTNILALNAAVEAARAGEQGRGFAVVASEVRNLASRSAAAANEIKALIDDSVQRVNQGNILVERAGATMQEVVASIKRVTGIVAEISVASAEQTAGVNLVGTAVHEMETATQQNAALVEQMAAATAGLNSQADELVASIQRFRI